MPDSEGNIKGISVPALPWLQREREAEEARQADRSPNLSALEKAKTQALYEHRWAGTD